MVFSSAQLAEPALQISSLESVGLSDEALRLHLENLYRNYPVQTFRRGQQIPLPEQKIWIVLRGMVLLNTLYPSGDEALLGFAVPSMPFGTPLTRVTPYSAIAFADVELLSLSLAEVEQSPTIQQALARQLNRRLQQSESMVALLGQRRVEERLKQFLLLLADELGEDQGESRRISLRITHQHLASALGTTRVTVTRILNQLRGAGWLAIDHGRHIVIKGNC
jgi:CRP-like cAMP-binding protein